MKRRQAGFSFIEILVVMSIIVVLVSMVVVLVPMIQEKAKRTKSIDNVRSMVMFYMNQDIPLKKGWPKFNGKNFVLYLVATGEIKKTDKDSLGILFSPGDNNYALESAGTQFGKLYEEVTLQAMQQGGGHPAWKALTSYAGRRNGTPGHSIGSDAELIICDDDDGKLHHDKGMVLGYTNGNAKFMDWSELGISPPGNPDDPTGLLGDNAPSDMLKHMSSATD